MEKKNWQNKVSRRLGLKISAGGGGGGGGGWSKIHHW